MLDVRERGVLQQEFVWKQGEVVGRSDDGKEMIGKFGSKFSFGQSGLRV